MPDEMDADGAREGNLRDLTDEGWLEAHNELLAAAVAAEDVELVRELTDVVYDPARKPALLGILARIDAADPRVRYAVQVNDE